MTTVTEPALVRGRTSVLRRVASNPKTLAGVLLLTGFVVLALAHPVLQATVWATQPGVYNPIVGHDPAISHPSGPGPGHLLGTDPLGRDVLSLLTWGIRPSLAVAATVAVVAGVLSLASGAASAYFKGRVDTVLSHLADALLLLPPPLLFLVVGRGRPDLGSVALGALYGVIFGLGPAAVVVRSRALTVMSKPFIEVARASGGGAGWITLRHLTPHLLPYVAVQVLAGVTGALITQGFLEVISAVGGTRTGLGSLVYLGLIYYEALLTIVPWSTLLAGGLTISLLAASFYRMSTGLADTLNIESKTRGRQ
jgi:peptide/nickel transport system permease protein